MNLDAGTGSPDAFLQASRFGFPVAMEGEVSGEDVLMQKLKNSRRRFQRHMQQLLEKVRSPAGPLGEARGRRKRGRQGWGPG